MTRVKRGVTAHRRHKKYLIAAKGYRGHRHSLVRQAKNAVAKAGQNAYMHRKRKKRDFRKLWIARINAACRAMGTKYSLMINGCFKKDIQVNRKMLAEIAVKDPEAFKAFVEEALG